MRIAIVDIQNFRKLKSCRVEISSKETILVGANNSGKTSAMDSMILFLKKDRRNDIATTDFTLSNWADINRLAEKWVTPDKDEVPDLSIEPWLSVTPSLDLWLEATEADLHHVVNILPTLDWEPSQKLGVRLVLVPKDVEKLYKDYLATYQSARETEPEPAGETDPFTLWPESMRSFLDKRDDVGRTYLQKYFGVRTYILDPSQLKAPVDGCVSVQKLPANAAPLDRDPFDGLLKIDVISAQRGFSDPKTEEASRSGFSSLSTQFRHYFKKHLDPNKSPDKSDVDALKALDAARTVFDQKLKASFASAITELEGLSYPGFSDPQISLTSKIQAAESLDHEAAVQFSVPSKHGGDSNLFLPEKYNGLGYQNLISMVFNLIRFRDEWMRVGKAGGVDDADAKVIAPLHVVLIEEPEAHLHVQVQQVFIKKAYTILRDHDDLKKNDCNLATQMVVSTHSSHIAHEIDFASLRYFRREPADAKGQIPLASVVNLSETFGSMDETAKFVKRYIRSTHCDLFFADATVLIEGAAERMLLPHFIRNEFSVLDQSYISLLEIGGSHAHRLRPLIETLGIPSLIITDLDAIGATGTGKVAPARSQDYRTGNTTLRDWIPAKASLDELLDLSKGDKQSDDGRIRVAYQCPIQVCYQHGTPPEEAIPYTFEDSLALTNIEVIRGYEAPTGLLKKLQDALNKDTLVEAAEEIFTSLKSGNKAGMALDLLLLTDPKELKAPDYIANGLEWLQETLSERRKDLLVISVAEVKGA